ncbi:NADH:flavin oxidoreductase/NADH oxidase [Alphaproteobacteria bacterium]|nr:NADH:flavin oxidoreductase/NADH oxidase [Alphaproteobacteria bacterium]
MSKLFSKLTIRGVTFPNRIVLSPLCMYSAKEGVPNEWHFSHLSTFARAKIGCIFAEATAVTKEGRITPFCLGLWNDKQLQAFKPIVSFIKKMGSIPAFQLAHAGRKAGTKEPWRGGLPLDDNDERNGNGAWNTIAPSAIPLTDGWQTPKAMKNNDINDLIEAYVQSAKLALEAGFEVLEIHAAHGYLLHSFLSPIANKRNDEYGGTLEGRSRVLKEITVAIRNNISDSIPLFCRISAVDGIKNGWEMNDSIELAKILANSGVDLVDCSSGGISGRPRFAAKDDGAALKSNLERGLGFQVPYADRIKNEVNIMTMAVGVIVNPQQAENILMENKADLIAMGRELMYNPFWSLHAAQELNSDPEYKLWPDQYRWGVNRRSEIEKFDTIK